MLLTFFSIVLRALHWLACFKYIIVDHNRIVLVVCQSHLILQFMVSTSGNNKI